MLPPRRFLPALALAVILASGMETQGRYFLPPGAPEKLEADGSTEALYLFGKGAVEKGEVPSMTGKVPAGKLTGEWTATTSAQLAPNYAGAGMTKPGAMAVFPGLKACAGGAFTIDVIARFDEWGTIGMQVGDGLVVNLSYGKPGVLELSVPVKGGKPETLRTEEVYRVTGQLALDDFYMLSVEFDGAKTFRFYINQRLAWTGVLQGEFAAGGDTLTLPNYTKGRKDFAGEIAAVRVSPVARGYAQVTPEETKFVPETKLGWLFDPGPPDVAPAAGTIRFDSANRFKDSPKLGYGWLELPRYDFEADYGAGSYRPTGSWAYSKQEAKYYDEIDRDGVVMVQGDIARFNVPDGKYWVSLVIGHNRGMTEIESISANGVVLGTNLRVNANVHLGGLQQRNVRGIVEVKDGKGIVISGVVVDPSGKSSEQVAAEKAAATPTPMPTPETEEAPVVLKDGETIPVPPAPKDIGRPPENPFFIPIKSIAILPYEPLPVSYDTKKSVLVWSGKGAAPKELKAVGDALKKQDFAAAQAAARKIADPFVRANVLAVILGQPKMPVEADVVVTLEIRDLLIETLHAHPDNLAARWFYDSNERFRHLLRGYLIDNGDEVVYGAKGIVKLAGSDLGLSLRPEDPEYWQGRYLAGAGIWQGAVQGSAFGKTSDYYLDNRGLRSFDAPGAIFREVIAAYPDFRLARVMLGEKLPMKSDWKAPANAPEWASLQYQLLHRLLDTIHYWVNERQDEKGLLGGGLGDDVEALRWWGPAVTLADDETTIKGIRKLSEAAWQSTDGLGFAKQLQDVEHSAEDISDSQPIMALVNVGTPEMSTTMERLTKMQPIFRDVWTTPLPNGQRMMKGHFLSATEVDREGDVPYNLRAIRPLLWAAWASQGKNKELDDLIVAYAASWRDAIMTEFDGKPKGIIPMMIMLDRSKAKKDKSDGYLDKPLSWVFPGYWSYEYPAGYSDKVYDLMLAGYELSGDKSFLEPVKFALEALRQVPDSELITQKPNGEGDTLVDEVKYARGSFDWAIRQFARKIGLAGANYRILTGDTSYDDVLLRVGPPHTKFLILASQAKDPAALAAAAEPVLKKLKRDLDDISASPELRTILIQSTDRIYVSGSLIIDAMSTGVAAPIGDLRGGEIVWPFYQITWRDTQGELAAMVESASPTGLDVLVYNFSDKPLKVRPRLWRLTPGTYQLALAQTDASGFKAEKELLNKEITVKEPGEELEVEIPSRVPAKLSFLKK